MQPRIPAIALVLVLVALASATLFVVAGTKRVVWNDGCGDDGTNYCHMVVGGNVFKPWSRRLLVSTVIRSVAKPSERGGVPSKFLVANVAALAAQGAAAFVLARRLCTNDRLKHLAGLTAGVVVVAAPMALRWTWMYPVLVDPVSAALGCFAILALDSRRMFVAAPVLAALATLARESWAPLLVLAATVLVLLPRGGGGRHEPSVRARGLALAATIGATVLAAVVAFKAPGRPDPVAHGLKYYVGYLETHLLTSQGRLEVAWLALFALGVIPLVWLARPVASARWCATHPRRPLLAAALLATMANAGLGLIGGADFHRFMASVAPLAIGVTVAAALSLVGETALTIAVVASAAVWGPWDAPDGTREDYYRIFSPNYVSAAEVHQRAVSDAIVVLVALLVIVAVYWAPRVSARARMAESR